MAWSFDMESERHSIAIQIGLLIVAALSVVAAVIHARGTSLVIDGETVKLLGIAGLAIVAPRITKLKVAGIELEQEVRELRKAVGGLEKEVGPGSKSAIAVPAPPALLPAEAPAEIKRPEDPNWGRFGGSANRDGRRLSASITPKAGPKSSLCRVAIRVESTDDKKPLSGTVRFYLHPTFGQWSEYDVTVKGGVAQDEIVSYGAFTIGALADDGKTALELNLMDVKGGTKSFYEN